MKTVLLIFFIFSFSITESQILTVLPEFPVNTDYIEIIYNASLGNGNLAGYNGDVYAHTGLITTESVDWHDWKHVVGNWGQPDPKVLMEKIGENLYKISYQILSFYNFNPEEETALQIAFVFRNADGSLIGTNADGTDIIYSINLTPVGEYLSHSWDGHRLVITASNGQMELLPYTANVLRVTFIPEGTAFNDTSYSVILESQSTSQMLEDHTGYLLFSYGEKDVIVTKHPLRLSFLENNEPLLSDELGIYTRFGREGVRFNLHDEEKLYGCGSRALPVNRRGFVLENYNQPHYGYSYGEMNLNISIPAIVSSEGYMLFFDSQWPGRFDLGATNPSVLDFSNEASPMPYFYISGDSFDDLLDEYTLLTGRQPLPPLWALGYLQSRYGYENEGEARSVVDQMRAEGFPMDAIILDLYWYGGTSQMCNMTWDISRWPNPVTMISDFKQEGIKTILVSEPYYTLESTWYPFLNANHYLCTNTTGSTYILDDFWTGPSALLDLTIPAARNWMWNFYRARINEGVEGWWCDLGEPESHPDDMLHKQGPAREFHNVYSLMWAQNIYEGYVEEYPDKRLFNLIRSGYSGMQRYSTFPWSGDVQKSWDGLQAQIPVMLGMGMNGAAYMASDLGGFAGSEQDNELYTRWMQFGTFCPVMRAHGSGVPTEPVFYPQPYKNILRNFIRLRYQLLPYNYTIAWKNSTTGRPLAMPMNYFDPGNPVLGNINDQYFWGENILVAPVMESDQTSREVSVPEGVWIDFWTEARYTGEDFYTINSPIERIPVLIKAGSFIPVTAPAISTDYYNSDTLAIWYYPDKDVNTSTDVLYLDDGVTRDAYLNGAWQIFSFSGDVTENQVSILIEKNGPGYTGAPEQREMIFDIKRISKNPDEVKVNGESITVVSTLEEFFNLPEAAYTDQSENTLKVHFQFSGEQAQVVITGGNLGTENKYIGEQASFILYDPSPNPFTNETIIRFDAREHSTFIVEIQNIEGKRVLKKGINVKHTGINEYKWNGKDEDGIEMGAGIYFVSVIDSDNQRQTKKLIKLE
ncbi:MAG: T9SS type A sorting domain-containing protein [Bacteroidetes bacterium]|nr:T9SS type A sorting domain-containing protein [Bacteroidota bacterium]